MGYGDQDNYEGMGYGEGPDDVYGESLAVRTYACTYMHVFVRTYVCMCVRMCMHVHVCVCACMYTVYLRASSDMFPNSFAFFLNVFHLLIGEVMSKQILASFVFYPGVVIVIVIII